MNNPTPIEIAQQFGSHQADDQSRKNVERHLPEILSYFRYRITNATSEGFNSRIQSIKSAARGFRDFQNYRTRILFYCGKLNFKPDLNH